VKLVFVHGRDQLESRQEDLKDAWIGALDRGFVKAKLARPSNVTVEFPYYAAELQRFVDINDSPLLTNILERGPADTSRADTFRAELLAEMAKGYGISDAEIQRELGTEPLQRAPQNWKWVLAIARALDRTPLREKTIDLITRDVFVYLSTSGTRSAIDALVAKLVPAGEPSVVVAHSLGSVVAYNVLKNAAAAQVRLFVTVGSPLGIRAVRELNGLPLKFPKCVERWFNARDTRDIVALRPLDEDNFFVKPPVDNFSEVDNFTENRHSIEGYLEDPTVASHIHGALTA
jgi:hypothetical protein